MTTENENKDEAGAETTAPGPAIFQGRELGSVERLTFYAGYHSTHPCKQQN